MSTTKIQLRGVSVDFPYEPYNIQKDYMEKVIECIQNETTAVLESPTGTGKTLSLLCASLAWLQVNKAKVEAQRQTFSSHLNFSNDEFLDQLNAELKQKSDQKQSTVGRSFLGSPTIIYASRTHSQLTQAMQEMRKTSYSYMKACVLGSRDQLCIHPEILEEEERNLRLLKCKIKVGTRSCNFFNHVDRMKDNPDICHSSVIDIEDMVTLGKKFRFCPYYMTREIQQKADIIFTPYNYLIDPFARKALGLNLANAVVILDEAHNIERVCEDTASIEIKSSDIALAIDEVTGIMKILIEVPLSSDDSPTDIDPDIVATFKEQLLKFEKALDDVPLAKNGNDIVHFPGDFIYELLNSASISIDNYNGIIVLIDRIVQFFSAQKDSPFARKGRGVQLFSDFLNIAFANKASKERVNRCYKVHIYDDETDKKWKKAGVNTWLSKTTSKNESTKCRVLNFWCFSPGFGMDLIISQNIKALILTSGTLAPLKPFITELELNVNVSLENPHIINENQIAVKILTTGPDGEKLNGSFRNRDNPKYISSLGRTVFNLTNIIPNGLLIFFPSYPFMNNCQEAWQREGIWDSIFNQKAIFIEPRAKQAFNEAMTGYYEKLNDSTLKGAIFMGVCKGKVSEGLDFADANGRAVIIIGLPYPPMKDPRVVLKQKYLDQCQSNQNENLTGRDWYSLEASRAVNQAIGRIIRHKDDYGAILLLDERFDNPQIKIRMSKWIRNHIQTVNKYGLMIRDISQFFRQAQTNYPVKLTPKISTEQKSEDCFGCGTSSTSLSPLKLVDSNCDFTNSGLVTIHNKRKNNEHLIDQFKRQKIKLVSNNRPIVDDKPENEILDPNISMRDFIRLVEQKIGSNFREFSEQLSIYRNSKDINKFIEKIDPLVPANVKYILIGLHNYIRKCDQEVFADFLRRNNLVVPD